MRVFALLCNSVTLFLLEFLDSFFPSPQRGISFIFYAPILW
uniref:Uncharacterized protein n=1 Tax=Arundo donax TaxID=35708 RepID=A0A0A9H7G3_ARUDO